MSDDAATTAATHLLEQMKRAFPNADQPGSVWVPLVPALTCDQKDRHVLAVAIGAAATHLVTENVRHFPPRTVPPGLAVVPPDTFLLDLLTRDPGQVMDAMETMSRRFRQPRMTVLELAEAMAKGRHAPEFGDQLGRLLTDGMP